MTSSLLDPSDLASFTKQFAGLSDPDLILLKSHMLVERLLFAALMTRLGKQLNDRVPKIGFGNVIELVVSAENDLKPLRCFNGMRNALAHELQGSDSSSFQAAAARMGVLWPTDGEERVTTARLVANAMLCRAFTHYLEETYKQLRSDAPGLEWEEIEEQDAAIDRLRADIADLEAQFTTH